MQGPQNTRIDGIPKRPGFSLYLFQRMPLQSLMLPCLKISFIHFALLHSFSKFLTRTVKASLPDAHPNAGI
jgi:hypothetical protein